MWYKGRQVWIKKIDTIMSLTNTISCFWYATTLEYLTLLFIFFSVYILTLSINCKISLIICKFPLNSLILNINICMSKSIHCYKENYTAQSNDLFLFSKLFFLWQNHHFSCHCRIGNVAFCIVTNCTPVSGICISGFFSLYTKWVVFSFSIYHL